jgi:hypothetical protein
MTNRNLSDETVNEIAFDLVRDHLIQGIEYLAISESVPEYEEDATEDDVEAVSNQIDVLLDRVTTWADENL